MLFTPSLDWIALRIFECILTIMLSPCFWNTPPIKVGVGGSREAARAVHRGLRSSLCGFSV